jgi:hypothetical protein
MKVFAVYAVTEISYHGYDSDPQPGIPIRFLTRRNVDVDDDIVIVSNYVVGHRELFHVDPVVHRNSCGLVSYRKDYEFIYAYVEDPSTRFDSDDD